MKPLPILSGGTMNLINRCKGCGETTIIYGIGYCRSCYKRIDLSKLLEVYRTPHNKVQPTYFQAFIFSKVKENFKDEEYISLKCLRDIFSSSKIPSKLHYNFIDDMELCGLLKKTNKKTIRLLK